MRYLDTSILVSALTNEKRSRDVYAWLEVHHATLCISGWGQTEFSAALSAKLRSQTMTTEENQMARRGFAVLVAANLTDVPVLPIDFRRAARLAEKHGTGLRGGDALHLAIAERQGTVLCTLDRGQAAAGAALNIATQLI